MTRKPAGALPATGGAYATQQDVRMNAAMIARAGNGEAHENRQPYLSLNYIIALQGIFPARS